MRTNPSPENHIISRRKKVVFILIPILLALVIPEWTARRMMTEEMKIARHILLNREYVYQNGLQNTAAQPYLFYMCTPKYGYTANGSPQHNNDGYRGTAVSLDKNPDVLRVLCLGGSTTYGVSVTEPHEAFPAVLEGMLRENLPSQYHNVEVMNGGLPWATTAELLTHFLFKYRYYQPDVVIINTGGNDAQGYALPYYHPDNSHWRQPMLTLRPLPRNWQWLARSRFLCSLILNIFYKDQLEGGHFVILGGAKPKTPWFRPGGKFVEKQSEIPLHQLSFFNNMVVLINAILSDGAKVLLVPFRAAPNSYRNNDFELAQVLRNENILLDMATRYRLGYAPFPASVISPQNWTDHCHLNAAGERQKARHIADFLLPMLGQESASTN